VTHFILHLILNCSSIFDKVKSYFKSLLRTLHFYDDKVSGQPFIAIIV